MAITVDWSTPPYLITIPQSDLTLVSGTRYEITVNKLWQLLRDFSDSAEAMPFPILYRRIPSTASTPAITEINDPFYSAEFEDGAYSVEIVDGNSNFRDVEVKNTVSVGTNNTTGFINPTFLQHSTFDGGVWVDTVNGSAGTDYPAGTPSVPSNNMVDAKTIANANGFRRIYIKDATLTLTTGDSFADFEFFGLGVGNLTLTVDAAADVTNSRFERMKITGTLDGNNVLQNTLLLTTTFVNGFIRDCLIGGTITLGGGVQANFVDVGSGIAGESTPTIDFGGSGQSLIARGYSGGILLTNKTGADDASIDLESGQVRLDLPNLTGGTIVVRGTGKVVDDATGDVVVSGTYSGMTLVNETVTGVELQELHQLAGLDAANPMTVTPTSRVAGSISQVISGDGETTTTVTRT